MRNKDNETESRLDSLSKKEHNEETKKKGKTLRDTVRQGNEDIGVGVVIQLCT